MVGSDSVVMNSQVTARFLQSLQGPDLVEPPRRNEPGQETARYEALVYRFEIQRDSGGINLNGFGAEYPESIIDIFHVRGGGSLVVAGNDTVTKNDVAPIPSVSVVEERHQSRLSGCGEIRFDFCVVTVQIGVAVENKKGLKIGRAA